MGGAEMTPKEQRLMDALEAAQNDRDEVASVANLLALALRDHLQGPHPCGSSRGCASLARYERWIAGDLDDGDYETMQMERP
jgi:hypothetical protein